MYLSKIKVKYIVLYFDRMYFFLPLITNVPYLHKKGGNPNCTYLLILFFTNQSILSKLFNFFLLEFIVNIVPILAVMFYHIGINIGPFSKIVNM